jgi:hypothetical protein
LSLLIIGSLPRKLVAGWSFTPGGWSLREIQAKN